MRWRDSPRDRRRGFQRRASATSRRATPFGSVRSSPHPRDNLGPHNGYAPEFVPLANEFDQQLGRSFSTAKVIDQHRRVDQVAHQRDVRFTALPRRRPLRSASTWAAPLARRPTMRQPSIRALRWNDSRRSQMSQERECNGFTDEIRTRSAGLSGNAIECGGRVRLGRSASDP